MFICVSPVTPPRSLWCFAATKHQNLRRNCRMNSVVFKPCFSIWPCSGCWWGHCPAGRAGGAEVHLPCSSQSVCVQLRLLGCASSPPHTTCLSPKASTDKWRSDLAIWPGLKDFALQQRACLAGGARSMGPAPTHTGLGSSFGQN